jgi:RNA polymerase sigma factor (sigma-70 family)
MHVGTASAFEQDGCVGRSERGGLEVVPSEITASQPDWAGLVGRIKAEEDGALEELYNAFLKGVRYRLFRQLGSSELDDGVHECFVSVVGAIRNGVIRQPECLPGFVQTVLRRQIAARIRKKGIERTKVTSIDLAPSVAAPGLNPEREAIRRQRVQLMREALAELSGRDNEILNRFYLQEQTQEQICTEMNLTETQFRLAKSRAKAKFGVLGQRLARKKPCRVLQWKQVAGWA